MRTRTWVLGLLFLLLPTLLLAPVWQLGGLGAREDDVLYYLPARVFFQESVTAGVGPWWSPDTGLGRPFLADPQNAVFYPFTWLFAVLDALPAYALVLWLHYVIAQLGMYRLLRSFRLSPHAAAFGALAFAFSGFMLAHRAHFAMQNAAAWTPWIFWRLQCYVLAPPERPGHLRRLAWAVAVMALQCFAGHVQMAALTAVGAFVFLAAQRWLPRELRTATVRVSRGATRWVVAWVLVVGVYAVQWLPTLEYARETTRTRLSYFDFVDNSWLPTEALAAFVPMLFGQRITENLFDVRWWSLSHQVEQFWYAGTIPLLLALLALRPGWRGDARRRIWGLTGIAAVVLALGTFTPLYPLLYYVPGAALFRCPARALLLVNLSLAALAAITLHDLTARLTPARARLRAAALRLVRRPLVFTVIAVGLPLVVVAALVPLLPAAQQTRAWRAITPWHPTVWVAFVVVWFSVSTLRDVVRQWQRPQLAVLLGLVTALDLGLIGWTIDVPYGHVTANTLTHPAHGEWLTQVRESGHRLWVVSRRQGWVPGEYIRPVEKCIPNTNVLQGITTLVHYGPLQPAAYVREFQFRPWGELEPPLVEARLRDTTWMREFDIGWVLLVDPEWPAPADCRLATTTADGWRLYECPQAEGRAYLQPADVPGAVRVQREDCNTLAITADTWHGEGAVRAHERAAVRIAELLALPGWHITMNGQPAAVTDVEGMLVDVAVPPGELAVIRGTYFPPGLAVGAGVSVISAGIVLALALLGGGRVRRRASGA